MNISTIARGTMKRIPRSGTLSRIRSPRDIGLERQFRKYNCIHSYRDDEAGEHHRANVGGVNF